MSSCLDSLLDADRMADIARNDAMAGLSAPPVEADESFFRRVDLAGLVDRLHEAQHHRDYLRLQAQQQRLSCEGRDGL